MGFLTSIKESEDEVIEIDELSLQKSISEQPKFSVFSEIDALRRNTTFCYDLPMKNSFSSFIKASKAGKLEDVKEYLENSSFEEIDKPGKCGWNALHYAIFYRHEALAIYLINK